MPDFLYSDVREKPRRAGSGRRLLVGGVSQIATPISTASAATLGGSPGEISATAGIARSCKVEHLHAKPVASLAILGLVNIVPKALAAIATVAVSMANLLKRRAEGR